MKKMIEAADDEQPIAIPKAITVAVWLLLEWMQEHIQLENLDKHESDLPYMCVETPKEECNSR